MSTMKRDPAILAMYDHAENRREQQIDRIWETMKLTTQIIFAIITATIALFELFKDRNDISSLRILMVLPMFMVIIALWAYNNTRRQYSQFLTIITWINKLEAYLGLRKSVDEYKKDSDYQIDIVYPKDTYLLLPDKWARIKKEEKTGKKFVEKRGKITQPTMYRFFSLLYFFYIGLAVILIWFIYQSP